MAFDPSSLDRFDLERPKPPPLLYKYVGPDRVDVLQGASIRFTPPLNTNDIFEVRQTFDLLMGPKMLDYFKEVSKEVSFDEQIAEAIKGSPLSSMPIDTVKAFVSSALGEDFETAARGMLGEAIEQLPAHMNSRENIDQLLERVASNQLLLSLSERPDSSPMWAQYADNSKGFVIAFDTSSEFFRRGERGELHGLHKVHYFDGRVPEIMDDPYAALISKTADWGYEHEWRLYAVPQQVTRVIPGDDDDIQLVSFPRDAVQRVILGMRMNSVHEQRIRKALEADYPVVPLMRAAPDRSTACLAEVPA